MKHAGIGTNYPILTYQVKVQHEKKPGLNLKSMQILGFEQTFTKFIEIHSNSCALFWHIPSKYTCKI